MLLFFRELFLGKQIANSNLKMITVLTEIYGTLILVRLMMQNDNINPSKSLAVFCLYQIAQLYLNQAYSVTKQLCGGKKGRDTFGYKLLAPNDLQLKRCDILCKLPTYYLSIR